MSKTTRGIIALDIDGTLTNAQTSVPQSVVDFLQLCHSDGWQLLFASGRSFQHGMRVLCALSFPYYLSAQNGAVLVKMPEQTVVAKTYLSSEMIPVFTAICEEEGTDFVIYSGPEGGDKAYYRAYRHSLEQREYFTTRTEGIEEWVAVESFEDLSFDDFPSIKCLGPKDMVVAVAEKLTQRLGLHVPVIRDPFSPNRYVAQGTHPEVSKGRAVADLRASISEELPLVIAAGDDNNDSSMLQTATVAIAMATAPNSLLDLAHVIAPPASECGIIQGLREALSQVEG